MKEAYLYNKLEADRAKCQNCAHYCQILPKKKGVCAVRENKDGKLYTLNYGKVIALNIDPIEKKPLFHFLPGTQSLSVATAGCNLKCSNCQNYDISQMPQLTGKIEGRDITPEEIINTAIENNVPSISYTYTEPAIFSEYAIDTMKLARESNLKNCWVSNGFWSTELFDLVFPYLDAINVDLKSFSDDFYIKNCGARLQPVLDTLKRLREKRIWIEITTLIIPNLNDKEVMFKNIAEFIKQELGAETPWHITQFNGAISWQLKDIPETSVETLQKAHQIGKEAGLKYVYTGNVPGIPSEDTFCPKCNALVIDRTGYKITRYDEKGRCPKCNEDLNLILK